MLETTCGFESRHRHHPRNLFIFKGLRVFLCPSYVPPRLDFQSVFLLFCGNFRRDIGGTSLQGGGIDAQDRIGRGDFGAEIQMRVDVRGGRNITVAQPFLNLPEAHAVGIQKAGTAMTEVVETDFPHTVLLKDHREVLGDVVGLDTLSQLVNIDIVRILFAVGAPAKLAVLCLLGLQPVQQVLKRLHQRQGTVAGFRLGTVFGDDRTLAV